MGEEASSGYLELSGASERWCRFGKERREEREERAEEERGESMARLCRVIGYLIDEWEC